MLCPSTHSRYWNLSELRNIRIQIDVLVCSFVFVLIIVFFFFWSKFLSNRIKFDFVQLFPSWFNSFPLQNLIKTNNWLIV